MLQKGSTKIRQRQYVAVVIIAPPFHPKRVNIQTLPEIQVHTELTNKK